MSEKPRMLVWFSCGGPSAVASKKAIEHYGSTHEAAQLVRHNDGLSAFYVAEHILEFKASQPKDTPCSKNTP